MKDKPEHVEPKNSKTHIIVEILEYVPNAVVCKTTIKKITGNVTVSSLDEGEELTEKTLNFDTYVQIIEGSAEVVIKDKTHKLRLGEGIIVPAHAPHHFNVNEQFKMLTTVTKTALADYQ